MKRWLPAPLLSASLLALWLVLNESVSPAHLLLGSLLAWWLPLVTAPLRPLAVRARRPRAILRLILAVGHDVIASNIDVARGILGAHRRMPNGAFVRIPLDLRDPSGLASLAMITTVVPGTVWSELAPDRSSVVLHIFDLRDRDDFIAFYKSRYERPLMEIFQ